jgi:hypothetical protein
MSDEPACSSVSYRRSSNGPSGPTLGKARMRENGEQSRGGIHDSAVAEIAARQGMTAEALKQRITRLNKKRSHK